TASEGAAAEATVDGPVPRDPLLIVVGPTAVGKSDFALLACERFGGEVVSVDSMQVYRGLDRGTSKPPPGVRRRVPHHGIDPADSRRIVRALEVRFAGGERLSDLIRASPFGPDRYPAVKIGLSMERGTLYRLIDERVLRFYSSGLVEEVRGLLAAGVPESSNAFKALGYREAVEHLRGAIDRERAIALTQQNTRR